MSYILDALKKAEADRDPQTRASMAIAQHDRRRNRMLVYGVLIALIINAGVLLWLFFPTEWLERASAPQTATDDFSTAAHIRGVPPDQEQDEQTVLAAELPEPYRPSEQPSRIIETPSPRSTATRSYSPPPTTASGETIIQPRSSNTLVTETSTLAGLPTDVRRRFPDLDFSTHIYADEPDLRAVVVNGVRLEEGDRLENLQVHEITEDGAIFTFENRLVSVSVLDAWN